MTQYGWVKGEREKGKFKPFPLAPNPHSLGGVGAGEFPLPFSQTTREIKNVDPNCIDR
jgi:hypothetical protein